MSRKYRKKAELPFPELASDHPRNRVKTAMLTHFSPELGEKLRDDTCWKSEGFDNRSAWMEHHLRDILNMD